ncbi:cytochrome P450 2K1-like [Rhinoraja longicauda]
MALGSAFPLDAATLLILGALSLSLLLYFRRGSKCPGALNLPPGPPPLPIIGHLHLLDLKKPHESLMELSEKYGPIFSIKLGTMKAVVLTGYETVKDALINHPDVFGGRAHVPIFEEVAKGHGIIFGHGDSWKQMRRFTVSTLRDFGMGRKTIEDKITEETHFLIKMFESHKGQEFNPTFKLNAAVANILCSIVFGDRFDYDDERFNILVKGINENIQLAGSPTIQIYNAFPILRFLGSRNKLLQNNSSNCGIIKNLINENDQKLDANNPRGFIDTYLLKQNQESGNPNTYFHEKNLLYTTSNLFAAGMETTSTTLRWAMLLMMKYPHVQEKVHEEIIGIIGSERSPRAEDRTSLPYTNAVIHEVQRFGNIVPMNIMHSTTADVNFRGYFIPKDTPVIPLLTSVLFDKTQWENPRDFNPSNFLDADGKFVKRDAFAPFSMGRRACAGETLARVELFLFFTTLIQKFRFQVPPNVNNLELVSGVGFTSFPKYQNVCAVCPSNQWCLHDYNGNEPSSPVAALQRMQRRRLRFDPDYGCCTVRSLYILPVICVGFLRDLRFPPTLQRRTVVYKLPPGPSPLPLIGNLHTLDLKMLHKSLTELAEQYGPVFTIQLGLEKVVVLTGYKAVKEALVDQADEFAERAKIPVLEMQANGYGISFGHGESWKQMRRFTLTTLRNFGMGKKTIEDKITEEAKYLVQEMESHQDQPFDTSVPVTSAMANIICSIVFGERFDYRDEVFLTITKLIRENFNLLGSSRVQMYNAFPFLGFLPGTHKKIFQNRTQMVQLILNFYEEHQKTLNENDVGSLIDAFLVKREEPDTTGSK